MKPLPRFVPNWPVTRPAMWLAFAILIGVLVYVSNRTGSAGPEHPVIYWDKLQHFVFFVGGAMAFGACLRATFPWHWSVIFLLVILVLSTLALTDEINQLRITGRSGGDPFDWLADLLGTVAGLAVLKLFYAKPSTKNTGTSAGD